MHECNVQLATFRNNIQFIGTPNDGIQLRKEIDNSARACIRSCETTKNCVLPQKQNNSKFLHGLPKISKVFKFLFLFSVLLFKINLLVTKN